MIVVSKGFSGKTGKDISIGCSKADVISRYGDPTRTLDTSVGSTLIYDSSGISFNFQGDDWFPGSCFERRNLPGSSHSLLNRMIRLLVQKLWLGSRLGTNERLVGGARPYFDTSARTGLVGPDGVALCIGFSERQAYATVRPEHLPCEGIEGYGEGAVRIN